jgi:pimeloyl-ACP methyl ester carboxylesterase
MGATFLVCHGAWSAGWAWKKMHPLMAAAGHRLVTPTYTGLGEREHLTNRSIDLETHIQDTLNVIRYEDLRDIVLIGHSYGGMVATGVADRARDRIVQLIYLDAFVPDDGQSLLDLNEPARQRMQELAKAGDGWRLPPNPTPPDTSPTDVEWLTERRVHMPIKCFETKLKLQGFYRRRHCGARPASRVANIGPRPMRKEPDSAPTLTLLAQSLWCPSARYRSIGGLPRRLLPTRSGEPSGVRRRTCRRGMA